MIPANDKARLQRARPNRLAVGMTYTLERQREAGTHRGYKSMDTATLAVHGTLDVLRKKAFGAPMEKSKCQCCGGTGRGRIVLTKAGKRRLEKLRAAR